MSEPFTITHAASERMWTRDTKRDAIALAENVVRRLGGEAVVTLTETGWEEYRTPKPAGDRWCSCVPCERCNGAGFLGTEQADSCPDCDGDGIGQMCENCLKTARGVPHADR